jgi:hypothetical protein
MDAISIVAIIAGIGGVVVALISHISKSKCLNCVEIDTYNPSEFPNTPPNTPQITHTSLETKV